MCGRRPPRSAAGHPQPAPHRPVLRDLPGPDRLSVDAVAGALRAVAGPAGATHARLLPGRSLLGAPTREPVPPRLRSRQLTS
ncbi:hypothetical protein RHRU231_670034 [Rhodococcus ruber]|uniref:Uncharacterized protein n=1 Tax=Rhodococcus ruber TaxID=1830 RepID=A0A098BPS2_9NOCA|nr:hypothetical protein RHRU231_670034 [Rhodococcus ruber]